MNRPNVRSKMIGMAAALILATASSHAAPPKKVMDLVPGLLPLGTDPVIVNAVKAQNAKPQTQAEIQKIQMQWTSNDGLDAVSRAILDNPCSDHLRDFAKTKRYYAEIFVKDGLGCNVAMTNKTTNYWHGNKDKFTKCFNSGEPYVGDVALDASTQIYLSQVSIPVKDGAKTIGVIIIGIETDQLR
jgi:hypothetical protein